MALVWNKSDLPTLAVKKVQMANEVCRSTIYAGIDVELSAGTEHFSLELHDQANIDSMFNAVTLGAKEYQYHSDGGQMKVYSAADIVVLYASYRTFVSKQTAYCNFLKNWIKREEDKEVLGGIVYGSELPSDLKAAMDAVLASSAEQLKNIVAAVNDGAFVDKIASLESQVTDAQIGLCEVYELALGGGAV